MNIHRYELRITDRNDLALPLSSRPLSVAPSRDRPNLIDLWVLVPEITQLVSFEVFVIGTGNEMPREARRFIGTVVMPPGNGVWHVFTSEES